MKTILLILSIFILGGKLKPLIFLLAFVFSVCAIPITDLDQEIVSNWENDIGAAINEAIDSGYYNIELPQHDSLILLTSISLGVTGVKVKGAGRQLTLIYICSDNVGLIFNAGYCELSGVKFLIANGVNHTKCGIVGTEANRGTIKDVFVNGVGDDGIKIIHGNSGFLSNTTCINNGGSGIHFANDTNNNHAWTFVNLDIRSNGEYGLWLQDTPPTGKSSGYHAGCLIMCQQNTLQNVRIESQGNNLTIYEEHDGTPTTEDGVVLTESAVSNKIIMVNGFCKDSSSDELSNFVINDNIGGSYRAAISRLTIEDKLTLWDSDLVGMLNLSQTADREYTFESTGSGSVQTVIFDNQSNNCNVKVNGRLYVSDDLLLTDSTAGIKMYSPDGTLWTIKVNDCGMLTTE